MGSGRAGVSEGGWGACPGSLRPGRQVRVRRPQAPQVGPSEQLEAGSRGSSLQAQEEAVGSKPK